MLKCRDGLTVLSVVLSGRAHHSSNVQKINYIYRTITFRHVDAHQHVKKRTCETRYIEKTVSLYIIAL